MDSSVPYLIFTLTVLLPTNSVSADEKCIRNAGSAIDCYECSTKNDANCGDPFNSTAHPLDLPLVKHCYGCCVKIVQNDNTPSKTITRTCTRKIKIKLFLVDHVCMTQSNGRGQICFCEDNQCNGGLAVPTTFNVIPLGLVFISLLLY